MAQDQKTFEPAKIAVAIALTFVAGYVDALGWLSLGQVFTAQMSGNAVLLAVHIVAGERAHAWLQADTIAAFSAGLVLSGSVIEIGMRHRFRRVFVVALAVEFLMLVAFAVAGHGLPPGVSDERTTPSALVYALVAVAAFAMGTQNTSLRMAGILSVYTTHLTGALTGLSEEIIVCGFSLLQPRRRRGFAGESLRARHRAAFANIGTSALLLTGFFGGAVAGASMRLAAGLVGAMIVPLAILIVVGIVDWVAPLTRFPSPAEQE